MSEDMAAAILAIGTIASLFLMVWAAQFIPFREDPGGGWDVG